MMRMVGVEDGKRWDRREDKEEYERVCIVC